MNAKNNIVLLFICCIYSCHSQEWVTVKLDSFVSISFPHKPQETGNAAINKVLVDDVEGLYSVGYIVVGFIPEGPAGLDSIYERMRQTIVISKTVTDVSVKTLRINGLIAREFNYKGKEGNGTPVIVKTLGLFINEKIYQCTYSTVDTVKYAVPLKRFLQSFTLSKDETYTQFTTK